LAAAVNGRGSFVDGVTSGLGRTSQGLLAEVAEAAADDYSAIKAGKYRKPWNMPPQLKPDAAIKTAYASPLVGAVESARFLKEAVPTLDRRQKSENEEVDTSNWLQSPLFPAYYRDSFHFQSDGWLSAKSAKVYDTSTETLFVGRQDLMQRTALLPLASWAASRKGLRILEVGCGTGKFSTFVRDNYPDADITLVDLSPFYLEQARKIHAKYGKTTGRGREPTFVQADGASLPFGDEEFDVVICMYVFHELPEQARADVAREMARVCSGLAVLTDSIQRGDRPKLDESIANFKKFNEPYYDTFLEEDLGALVEVHGFKPHEKHLSSVTKTLSLTREAKAEVTETKGASFTP
jgi:ubiquinone/menaquinone biosynthesis C-methylase UbiE